VNHRMTYGSLFVFVSISMAMACNSGLTIYEGPSSSRPDVGAGDAPDAAVPAPDTGAYDTGTSDTGVTDTGVTDTGMSDTGVTDTSLPQTPDAETDGAAPEPDASGDVDDQDSDATQPPEDPGPSRVIVQKRWDNGPWVQSNAQDDALVEGSFRRTQAYDRCEDVRLDTTTRYQAEGTTFDTIYVEARRGDWYGTNTDTGVCGDQIGSTNTSRSETYTSRNMRAEGAVGMAFRYLPNSPVFNRCRTVILQRHSAGGESPQISLRIGGERLWVESKNVNGTYAEDAGPIEQDRWHRVVVLYNLTDGADGYIHVILDGELKTSYTGPTTGSPSNPTAGNWKFGHYMANLYGSDSGNSNSCATPPELTTWTYNFARFAYASIEDGTHAELVRAVDPQRRDAIVDAYPDGSLPLRR
jgi:hypothetical protein